MASVAITIPNALVPRLTAAMQGTFPETVGQDPAAAFKEITSAYWRKVLVDWEAQQAEKQAYQQQLAALAAAKAAAATDAAGIV